ncbi:MAG: pseudouridine synthase [Planktomarina sp.]
MDMITFIIGEKPPKRLDKALARDVPEGALSRSRIAKLLVEGAVTVDGQVVTDGKAKVAEDAEVTITVPLAAESHMLPQDIPLNVVFEDAHLIVVNKPAGMVVHPAPGTPDGTLVNALMHHCGDDLSGVGGVKRPGIVHRIDKDTTGLLVVAKSDEAHHGLASQFEDHSVERLYKAVCFGVPSAADPRLCGLKGVNFEPGNTLKLTTYLDRHKTDRQKQAVYWDKGRHAVTRATVERELGGGVAALVTCKLETGRTHQIRVHMNYAGHVLIGDQTYGGRRRLKGPAADIAQAFPRQALHAATLGFEHPVTHKRVSFEAPIPDDMAALIAAIG